MHRARSPALFVLLLPACVIGSEKWPRPRDLAQSWWVDRTRILAIVAEPPEVRPGEVATFAALIPSPDEAADNVVVWFACPPEEEGGIGYGCFLDLTALDFETASPDELASVGFIGIEPGLPPSWEAPADLLDGIEDEGLRREGLQVLVQVSAIPAELLEESPDELDFGRVEVGYKRLIVSEATTPNHNPRIAELTVDGHAIPPEALVHVDRNQSYELGAVIDEATVERYEYLASDGQLEHRTEEPYVAWFATGGEVTEHFTLYGYTESTWISPGRAGAAGTWYAVLRDRRGGMHWRVQDWVVD